MSAIVSETKTESQVATRKSESVLGSIERMSVLPSIGDGLDKRQPETNWKGDWDKWDNWDKWDQSR
jgi:hypothetical protein